MPHWWKTAGGEWRIRTSIVIRVKDGWRRVVISVEIIGFDV